MRKVLLTLLLAGTAVSPALAQRSHGDRPSQRESRQSARSDARSAPSSSRDDSRDDSRDRSDRADRPSPRADRDQPRTAAPEQAADAASMAQRRAQIRDQVQRRAGTDQHPAPAAVNERGRPTLGGGAPRGDTVANWRRDQREDVHVQHPERVRVGRTTPPSGARPDRPAPLPATAAHRGGHSPQWRGDWRRDHRYDWREHRRNHRSTFHLGVYFDPFGWGYRRYNVGWRLWPNYYNSNHWLNDPYSYRLPYAPWPLKWVRYYDDALLVNTMTGQVEDVIYDVFW